MEQKEKDVEFKLYDFMNTEVFNELKTAVQYVDYFMTVKQDVLIQLDGVQCAITNAEIKIAEMESKELLNTDFKQLYGKANERIEKAHMRKVYHELYDQLVGFKYQKKVLNHQVDILNDMIKANRILMSECTCNCGSDEE